MALLFDALMHPDADMGAENPPLVDWKREINHSVRHMVLGKGKPGGAWQVGFQVCLQYSVTC